MKLQDYPRPKNDNGIGLHFRLDLTETDNKPYISQGIEWLQIINAKWTLVAGQDWEQIGKAARLIYDAGIMPVCRLVCKIDKPFIDWETGVKTLHDLGIPAYMQIFNEPGDYREWKDENPKIDVFGTKWADAAGRVFGANGLPGMGGVLGQDEWLAAFNAVEGGASNPLWSQAWFCVHNYGSNHPPNYPYDDVNQKGTPCTPEEYAKYKFSMPFDELNALRRGKKNPGDTIFDDDTAVLRVHVFKKWMVDSLGYCLPMIGGEGGWQWQTEEDLRYPKLPDEFHAQYTREMFEWFRFGKLSDGTPLMDELFCCTAWIEADGQADSWWFGPLGTKQGTIDAVASIPSFVRKFSWDVSEPIIPQPIEIGLPPAIEIPSPVLTDPNVTRPLPDLDVNVPTEPEPLPVLEPTPVAPPADPPLISYTVQQGETLWGIAKKFGTTVEALVTANEIQDKNKVRAGQKLVIPR
ncbi:MAG: LysM peptidoglycan-binding domain-containing protein [Chloroflexota bacterium]|nr:MAG: LysM peptidoglycan-binding domain-containing protein [Chloroflexota bacterium]